jgi:hypothetical protein
LHLDALDSGRALEVVVALQVRVKAIGEVEGIVFVVIYTDRDDVRWIISPRQANRKERSLWHA